MNLSLRDGMPVMPIGPEASPMDFGGSTELGLYTEDVTQRHAYGRRALTWDGRVFKYGKSTNIVAKTSVGLKFEAAVAVAATVLLDTEPIGSTQIHIDAGAASALAKNVLAGGYLILNDPTWSIIQQRLIIGNDLSDADGYTYIYLDAPFPAVQTKTTYYAEICYNPWSALKYRGAAGDAYGSVAGLPATVTTVANYNLWVQTWGPCFLAPQSPIGTASLGMHNRQLTFRPDGAIDQHDSTETYNAKQQHAGFILTYSTAGADGPPLIMLQISI